MTILSWVLLVPVVAGSVYAMISAWAVLRFFSRPSSRTTYQQASQPPVSVLKPVCGLEKDLRGNLESICRQDYPVYQVVFCVQDPSDPALRILREIEGKFGSTLVSVVVRNARVGANGKVNNLVGGLSAAKYDTLVVSDSDTVLPPNYLATLVAPLADPGVGGVCSLHKSVRAKRWVEQLELLSMNGDYMPSVIFAQVTGAAKFFLGPSIALRRSTLEEIGGFEGVADYLAEDHELGRRIWSTGKKVVPADHVIDTVVDLESFSQLWTHQLYWDVNLRVANPGGFFATVVIRSVPFAALYALVELASPISLAVLGAAIAIRLVTTGAILRWGLQDREGLRYLAWMPLRDLLGLLTWMLAFLKRTVVWRGVSYRLTGGGKMVPLDRRHVIGARTIEQTTSTR